jgi:SAM-dependent methyltransferase
MGERLGEYRNHNTAFHPHLVRLAQSLGGRALDVGAGDGLLVERLARVSDQVVGIDPDAASLDLARKRTHHLRNVSLVRGDFVTIEPALEGFDIVTCVATLHHMELRPALRKLGDALRPGGTLVVIGLSANRSVLDWIAAAAQVPILRLRDRQAAARAYPGVVTAVPQESLSDIRRAARGILPGVSVRRRFYYRYELRWQKPHDQTP